MHHFHIKNVYKRQGKYRVNGLVKIVVVLNRKRNERKVVKI